VAETGAEPGTGKPTLETVRAYLRDQYNSAVRRPGMFGGEMALRLYIDALEAAYGHRYASDSIDSLQERGAFNALGVLGPFTAFWPGLTPSDRPTSRCHLDDMVASVYAEVGHQQGWLDLDRPLTSQEHDEITRSIKTWCKQDRTSSEVLGSFGPPSVLCGGSGSKWPKTLVYATDHPDDPCISFHLWNSFTDHQATEYPEPVVIAARREGGKFTTSFVLTPIGRERRRKPSRPSRNEPAND
jgi:hypothetical protein